MEVLRSKLLFITDSSTYNKINKLKAKNIEQELWQLEGKVHDIWQTGARQDIFRNPSELLEQFLAISKEAIISSADAAPTDQDNEVYLHLNKQLQEVMIGYAAIKQSLNKVDNSYKIKSTLNNNHPKN